MAPRQGDAEPGGASPPAQDAIANATPDEKVDSALDAFAALFFNNMTIVIDRYFVYRLRMVTGKDGNPLNEVEMLSDPLMNNKGILRYSNVITKVPVALATGSEDRGGSAVAGEGNHCA